MSKTIEDRLAEGRQYRDADLGSFEHRAEDDGRMIIRGYATTFNQPYELYRDGNYTVLEQVDSRAFDEADVSDCVLQYNHEGHVYSRLSNNTLRLTTDEHGLMIEAELGGTAIGRQLYEEVLGGYTTKMSFGFTIAEDARDVAEDHDTGEVRVLRTIKKIRKLYDTSLVSQPANPGTSVSARNFGEGVIAEVKEEIRQRQAREEQKKRILEAINGDERSDH